MAEIERKTALVAVLLVEIAAAIPGAVAWLILRKRRVADAVDAAEGLDLDDVGSVVRQNARGERPGPLVREVQDTDPLERQASPLPVGEAGRSVGEGGAR